MKYKEEHFLKIFGENLRKIRLEKGFSQEMLADQAELPLSQIGRIERGEISTASSQEMYLLLEHTSRQLGALENSVADGKAVSINKQQELTLKFLGDRVDTLEDKIENLRDKIAEMKANGNGVH